MHAELKKKNFSNLTLLPRTWSPPDHDTARNVVQLRVIDYKATCRIYSSSSLSNIYSLTCPILWSCFIFCHFPVFKRGTWTYLKHSSTDLWLPRNILAPYFCNRWRWEEGWILRWLDGALVRLESNHDCNLLFQETIRQLASLITVMFWSRMSDHVGRKPILLLGMLALAISNLSFGLSRTFWAVVVR